MINSLCEAISDPSRLLPGGYLYLNDILGDPVTVQRIGKMIATAFMIGIIDVVMTIATKGIPLAYGVANYLNVPVVIVRNDNIVTEGPTVSINYVSGSTKRILTMLLSKRSLAKGSKVLIIDDFMKAGGTINGMINLLEEFQANWLEFPYLVEAEKAEERLVEDYLSLIKLSDVDYKAKANKSNRR